jgi:Do/DeqQ family serine protease
MMYRFMPTLLLMMWFSVSSQAQVDQSKDQQGTHEKLPIPLQAPEPTPSALPTSREEIKLSYAKLVKDVAPAVVNIFASSVTKTQTNSPLYEDPFFKQFFGEDFFSDSSPMRIQRSLGSGVIVRNDGIIITSYHVIQNAKEIKVVLSDGRELEAEVVATEPRTDLAALRLKNPPVNLPFLKFKDVDDIEVGDLVLAIGNPFGIGQTVTSGIVSALARTQIGVSDFSSFIQTDAAINPGNSGGALVTMDGRLAGINTAILSKSGGSIGIGFAIPSNLIIPLIESLSYGGKIMRPWVGARVKSVTQDVAKTYKLDLPIGVVVTGIYPGSPAEKAGLELNDLILSFDGKEIRNEAGFLFRIASRKLTDKIELQIVKPSGEHISKTVQLEAPPEGSGIKPVVLRGRHPLEGATVADLTPALATNLGVDFMEKGIIVLAIEPGSPARRIGILPGDIIYSVNDQPIETVDALANWLTRARGNLQGTDRISWKIEIKRGGKSYTIVLQ